MPPQSYIPYCVDYIRNLQLVFMSWTDGRKKTIQNLLSLDCSMAMLTLIHICGVRVDPGKLYQVFLQPFSEPQNQRST